MVSSLFEDIASHGVAGRPLDRALELIAQLETCCRERDDQACCAFAGVLQRIEDWRRQHESAGGVPRETLTEIDDIVRAAATSVLSGSSGDTWTELLGRVELQLLGPDGWVKRGQAIPRGFE